MRLWTLHPKYLDRRGLVAVWREGLLAQAVLRAVHAESVARSYCFDAGKISRATNRGQVAVARGQLEFEWGHLMAKLERRDPGWRARLERVKQPQAHPVFRIVPGAVEKWERGGDVTERVE